VLNHQSGTGRITLTHHFEAVTTFLACVGFNVENHVLE